MLKKSILSALILVTGLMSAQANAALVATDWKSSGDGLATLDTKTGIEWLDVSITDGMSIQEVSGLLSSTYKGWRLPSYAEVQQLFVNALGLTPGAHSEDYSLGYDLFLSSFGSTYSDYVSYGTYVGPNGVTVFAGGAGGRSHGNVYTDYTYGNTISTGIEYAGVFLVSDGGTTLSSVNNPTLNINNPNAPVNQPATEPADVSAHAGLGLFGLALIALGGRRRKSA